jgi:glycerol-3-phosphate acyltransferase PlsY
MVPSLLIAALAGYLLGSLPFGYLVARAKGVNIFEVGSKSSGATNVRRVLGSGAGNLVFLLDLLKGSVAAGWPLLLHLKWLDGDRVSDGTAVVVVQAMIEQAYYMAVVGLICALVGHSYSCFTKFRGGKGVATGAGGLLVLLPAVALIAVAVWTATFFAARYVSLASILAALTLPVAAFLLKEDRLLIGLTLLIAIFVIVRHRANIGRLLNGTESKFVKKPHPSPPPAA